MTKFDPPSFKAGPVPTFVRSIPTVWSMVTLWWLEAVCSRQLDATYITVFLVCPYTLSC